MATTTEVVYVGSYNNRIDLLLMRESPAGVPEPMPLGTVIQIDANINGVDVISTNGGADLIRWDLPGYAEGEIRCEFGSVANLELGQQFCWFITYDPTNLGGIVFDPIILDVNQLP